jgi:hypothetical protein
MVTFVSPGDKIHVGDSVTLTVLAIEGNLIRVGVESSEPGSPDPSVLIEGNAESDLNWWHLNSSVCRAYLEGQIVFSVQRYGRAAHGQED